METVANKILHETGNGTYDVAILASVGSEIPVTVISNMAERLEAQLQAYCRELHSQGITQVRLCLSTVVSVDALN